MNRFYFYIALFFGFFTILAQDYPLNKGAKIVAAQNSIFVDSDQLISIPIEILRSKEERRTKFAVPKIQNVVGLKYEITATETRDQFILTLDTSEMPNGDYNLIIKGSGQFKRYLTSTMVALKVTKESKLIVNNQ